MKFLIASLILTVSFSSFAQDKCYKKVSAAFLKLTPSYEHHSVAKKYEVFSKRVRSFESWGKLIELRDSEGNAYNREVRAYPASNEYYSGYGAYELIVDPVTCEILKDIEVYSE